MKTCQYERALRRLVAQNQAFIRWIDAEMLKPSTHERGQRIAAAVNALNRTVDAIQFHELGVDVRRDRTPKE